VPHRLLRVNGIDFHGRRLNTDAMGVRTRGLDIKAGAAKFRADRAACEDLRVARSAAPHTAAQQIPLLRT
jgi:hypothetical protein